MISKHFNTHNLWVPQRTLYLEIQMSPGGLQLTEMCCGVERTPWRRLNGKEPLEKRSWELMARKERVWLSPGHTGTGVQVGWKDGLSNPSCPHRTRFIRIAIAVLCSGVASSSFPSRLWPREETPFKSGHESCSKQASLCLPVWVLTLRNTQREIEMLE